MEEPKIHIHDKMVSELNEMSIRLKLWHSNDYDNANDDQKQKILKARESHKYITDFEEIISLIDRCRDEMNQCTKPYKIY